jgi:hypothetical protein
VMMSAMRPSFGPRPTSRRVSIGTTSAPPVLVGGWWASPRRVRARAGASCFFTQPWGNAFLGSEAPCGR